FAIAPWTGAGGAPRIVQPAEQRMVRNLLGPTPTSIRMTTSLETLLNPRGIAVVGAPDDRSKVGGQALHVLRAAGFRGSIHAVNPKLGEIDGIACHPSVRAIPGECDLTLV